MANPRPVATALVLLFFFAIEAANGLESTRYGSASNGTLPLERYSAVAGGKLLPGFLFMQGESDGLEQTLVGGIWLFKSTTPTANTT